ncbi:hypothetical protein BH10PSE7_BH10PSE7_40660 [soil metagenome]
MTITYANFTGIDRERTIRRLRRIARIMDTALRIPGTRIRFGADSVVGLLPGIGDLMTLGVSLYAVCEAYRIGIPRGVLLKMMANVAIDTGLGAVPLVGDVFDLFFKSNTRNLHLLLDHLDEDLRP